MSLAIRKAPFFIADFELQYAWYFEKANPMIAGNYLAAIHETLLRLAQFPGVGRTRRFRKPQLNAPFFSRQCAIQPSLDILPPRSACAFCRARYFGHPGPAAPAP